MRRTIRISVAVAAACVLLAAGCEFMGFYEPSAPQVTFAVRGDEPIELEVGQTAILSGLGVSVRFTDVVEDSRCPRGVDCFWEGRVRAAFVLIEGDRTAAATVEGFVSGEAGEDGITAEALGYRITLLALAPYPIVHPSTGAPVDQGAATAVLEVERL